MMKLKTAKNLDKQEERPKINPREIQKSYLEKMESDLESKGVVFFEVEKNLNIDADYLNFSANVTDVPSRELGEHLNALTQQKMYLRTLLGRAELLMERARRDYYEVSESAYKRYSSEKMSETAKERLINSRVEVRPKYYEYLDRKKDCNLVEYSINNVEDAIFMISREVTRRSGDFFNENRNESVQRR